MKDDEDHHPVRWRREFLVAGARFDVHGGEWFAGLVIGTRRKRRLILDESRVGEFAIPLTDPLDPYADEVILSSQQIERLSAELKAGRASVTGWQRDYADALLLLCDEAMAQGRLLYYVGP